MNQRQAIATGLAVLGMATALHAQATSQTEKIKGEAKVDTVKMTGEVVQVQGEWLLAKMQPLGNYSLFHVQPGREFMIDGQVKHIADLKPGTVLTGTIVKKVTPVTVRTTSTLNGTVWWAQGNYVVLTLENGEQKEYKVPESYKFMVEGKPATVHELKPGMKVTATKIVEEPQTELSTETVITGKAPNRKSVGRAAAIRCAACFELPHASPPDRHAVTRSSPVARA